MRCDNFFELRSTKTTMTILISCLNANVRAPTGPHSLRNGSLIFGIVCLVTLLIFLHSLHLGAPLNAFNDFLFCVMVLCVLRLFLFYIIIFFISRVTVSAVLFSALQYLL